MGWTARACVTEADTFFPGTRQKALKAKIAVFTCPLDVQMTETKGTVLIKNAGEMLNFSKGEESQMEQQFREIAESGANVLVTGSSIGDLALHFINRLDMVVVKVLSKFDLRRLCKVVGATALTRVGKPLPEELGNCDIVETVEIGSDRCTVFRQGWYLTWVDEKLSCADVLFCSQRTRRRGRQPSSSAEAP